MNLRCDGDYEILHRWLEKHRDASMIVVDANTGLPVKAEYVDPIWQSYVADPAIFFGALREKMAAK